jgi:hypothetical protein
MDHSCWEVMQDMHQGHSHHPSDPCEKGCPVYAQEHSANSRPYGRSCGATAGAVGIQRPCCDQTVKGGETCHHSLHQPVGVLQVSERSSLLVVNKRHCWLRLCAHRWSPWIETMVGSFSRCEECGTTARRDFVQTYIR